MNHRFTVHLTALAAVALLLVGASQALAVGTLAGQDISNTATLIYDVGGIAPPAITSLPATFRVDHKIVPVVTNNGGAAVVPNGSGYALTFVVENQSNTKATDTLQLKLEAIKNAGFDMNDVKIYQEDTVANISGFDSTDDEITAANPFISLAHDSSVTIYIVATCPPDNSGVALVNSDTSSYHLLATAWAGGADGVPGAALAQGGANGLTTEEVVFADASGSLTDDDANEGQHSASGAYTVATAALTVQKTVAVFDTGSSLPTDTFALPGSIMTYTITINNATGSQTAGGVTLIDTIPADTSFYVTSGPTGGVTYAYSNQSPFNPADPTWTETPAAAAGSGVDTDVTAIKITTADIAADEQVIVTFKVKIN